MVRITSALFLALSAVVANAHDFSAVPGLASIPAAPDAVANPNAVFVNDVNNAPVAAPAGNGFGLNLPQARSAEGYTAPQLLAPHAEELPEVVPQNSVASALTAAQPEVRSNDQPPAFPENQPHPIAAAAIAAPDGERALPDPVPQPEAAAAMAAPSEARAIADSAPQPEAAAAMATPGDDRAIPDNQPHPIAAAAIPAPNEVRAATDAAAPVAAPAEAAPGVVSAAALSTPVDTSATNFKSDDATDKSSSSGGHIATFAAIGAACVVAVAAFAIVRKRNNLKQKCAKTPGTPKNELTFFHVQSRLTPPPV